MYYINDERMCCFEAAYGNPKKKQVHTTLKCTNV